MRSDDDVVGARPPPLARVVDDVHRSVHDADALRQLPPRFVVVDRALEVVDELLFPLALQRIARDEDYCPALRIREEPVGEDGERHERLPSADLVTEDDAAMLVEALEQSSGGP